MKFNFKWGKADKPEMTAEIPERNVNKYQHDNPIRGAEQLELVNKISSQFKNTETRTATCKHCGKAFITNSPKRIYCGERECTLERDRINHRERKVSDGTRKSGKGELLVPIEYRDGKAYRKCVACGKEFEMKGRRQLYCSQKCSYNYAMQNGHGFKPHSNGKTPRPSTTAIRAGNTTKPTITETNKYAEAAKSLRALYESGSSDFVIEKYLEAMFGA